MHRLTLAFAATLAVAACSPEAAEEAPAPEPAAPAAAAPPVDPEQAARIQALRDNWNIPTEPFHIIDNIYYVGTQGLGAYLFTTDEGHILLDGALEESVPLIEANIATLGFELADVKILLNSHAHFDHSAGLAQLKADTGAQLVAMEGDVSALEGGFYLGSEDQTLMNAPPVKVDRIIHDGDTVELGNHVLTAHHTPGHTRGCTSWGTTASAYGDNYEVLVFCSASVAANRLVGPEQYEGIVDDYRSTFEIARNMSVDIPLAPHPDFFDLIAKRDAVAADDSENPFIDPTAFAEYISAQESAFEAALEQQIEATGAEIATP